MKDIAICTVGYNRPESMTRLLQSLSRGIYPSDVAVTLYISIDKSDSDNVVDVARSFDWKHGVKQILTHEKNLGLRRHILSCGDLLEKHDALIVLEDDVVVAPGFYQYATQTVERYSEDDNIAGISLYNFPVNYQYLPINYQGYLPFIPVKTNSDIYLMQCAQSWGQVWMKKQWQEFKRWYANNSEEFTFKPNLPATICSWGKSSWLKYHTRYCIESGKYFVYPYTSFSTCFADAGVHVRDANTIYQTPLHYGDASDLRLNPSIRYDGYFECENIAQWLDIPMSQLCIDFYGENGNSQAKRYWLTRKAMPYKVVRAFALQCKPYPLNVYYGIPGNELFLYDTSVVAAMPTDNSFARENLFLSYMYKRQFTMRSVVSRYYHRVRRLLHIEK